MNVGTKDLGARPAPQARITIVDIRGQPLDTGATDDQGAFVVTDFPSGTRGDLVAIYHGQTSAAVKVELKLGQPLTLKDPVRLRVPGAATPVPTVPN